MQFHYNQPVGVVYEYLMQFRFRGPAAPSKDRSYHLAQDYTFEGRTGGHDRK
jgi:hypothetical protein